MALDLSNYEALSRVGVQQFWTGRGHALENDTDRLQGGERSAVLGGKNMDGFLAMVEQIVRNNGLPDATIHVNTRPMLTLPGYFRPTKLWDVVVIDRGQLVAAIEFKSHVGPSFGNNFNNRTEEAIGMAFDLITGIRNGGLGPQLPPFLGWLILVEDCEKSRRAVRDSSPHFPVDEAFQGSSYLTRYDALCRRLMDEGLYTRASVLASSRSAALDGSYSCMSVETSLLTFVEGLAEHTASWRN